MGLLWGVVFAFGVDALFWRVDLWCVFLAFVCASALFSPQNYMVFDCARGGVFPVFTVAFAQSVAKSFVAAF